MRDNFCVFILSYKRVGDIPTLNTLDKVGYSGNWYIIIDHKEEIEEYKEEYGEEKVIYFDKEEVIDKIDRADNLDRRDCNVYARNKVFEIAEDLGYNYFLVLDDDYTEFAYRFDKDLNYNYSTLRDLDSFLDNLIEYLDKSRIDTIALAQGGDFIGGSESSLADRPKTKRKAMNSFLFKTDRPIEFIGRINEDVNTYIRKQQLGRIFLTTNITNIQQELTQQNKGGLTDAYLDYGTYTKSFYTILFSPSCVKLTKMGNKDLRIHHKVEWNKAVPKIIPEEYKVN